MNLDFVYGGLIVILVLCVVFGAISAQHKVNKEANVKKAADWGIGSAIIFTVVGVFITGGIIAGTVGVNKLIDHTFSTDGDVPKTMKFDIPKVNIGDGAALPKPEKTDG